MKIPRKKISTQTVFFGLDIMTRNAGIVGINVDGDKIVSEVWDCPTKGIQRLNYYFERFLELIAQYPSAYYGIEDYAYGIGGKNSRSTFTVGEITGTYKLHLYRARLPLYIFGIGQIKKFFTSSGVASKEDMINRALEMVEWIPTPKLKKDIPTVSHIADAYAICLMTRYYACGSIVALDSSQISWLEARNAREFAIR